MRASFTTGSVLGKATAVLVCCTSLTAALPGSSVGTSAAAKDIEFTDDYTLLDKLRADHAIVGPKIPLNPELVNNLSHDKRSPDSDNVHVRRHRLVSPGALPFHSKHFEEDYGSLLRGTLIADGEDEYEAYLYTLKLQQGKVKPPQKRDLVQQRQKYSTWDTNIVLVDATPYRWRKGYCHQYQIPNWCDDFPDYINPGDSLRVLTQVSAGKEPKDSAAEVVYHIEGVSKPMSFRVEYRPNKGKVWVAFLEDLETLNNAKKTEHRLGFMAAPGAVAFVVAGKEGEFISSDPPLGWMQAMLPQIGHFPLREIVLHRSHHAGLWKSTTTVGLAVPETTRTQIIPLYDQLGNGGVRVIDFRPVWWKGEWYEGHGARVAGLWFGMIGSKLSQMIDQINRFNDANPGELIIFDIHGSDNWNGRYDNSEMKESDRKQLYEALLKLKHRMPVPDGEDLTQWPLERFIGNKTSAVLIRVHAKRANEAAFPGGKEGFVSGINFPIDMHHSAMFQLPSMMQDQFKALENKNVTRASKLYNMDWLMTQTPSHTMLPLLSILQASRQTWQAFYHDLWDQLDDVTYPNWITMDRINDNSGKALVMAMNQCLVARLCGTLGGKVTQLVGVESTGVLAPTDGDDAKGDDKKDDEKDDKKKSQGRHN